MSPAFEAVTLKTHPFHYIMRPVTCLGSPGGGVSVIIIRHKPNVKFSSKKFSTFECIEVHFHCSYDKTVAYLVYRPTGQITNDFSLLILRVY